MESLRSLKCSAILGPKGECQANCNFKDFYWLRKLPTLPFTTTGVTPESLFYDSKELKMTKDTPTKVRGHASHARQGDSGTDVPIRLMEVWPSPRCALDLMHNLIGFRYLCYFSCYSS